MAKSFFKILTDIENRVILSPESTYSDETKEIVQGVVSFVESGSITDASIAKFICKNFRLDNQSMLRAYNISVPYDKMISTSTLRSYISRLSNELYDVFGLNFYEIFIENDINKQRSIKSTLGITDLEDLSFKDLFIGAVDDKASRGLICNNITIDDCEKEIEVLKLLTNSHVEELLSQVDANKLAYLRRVLNRPIINSKALNYEKVELLQMLKDED